MNKYVNSKKEKGKNEELIVYSCLLFISFYSIYYLSYVYVRVFRYLLLLFPYIYVYDYLFFLSVHFFFFLLLFLILKEKKKTYLSLFYSFGFVVRVYPFVCLFVCFLCVSLSFNKNIINVLYYWIISTWDVYLYQKKT